MFLKDYSTLLEPLTEPWTLKLKYLKDEALPVSAGGQVSYDSAGLVGRGSSHAGPDNHAQGTE